ncbi:hypothetical protein AYI68_g7431, partial [Smittium mucronatum]
MRAHLLFLLSSIIFVSAQENDDTKYGKDEKEAEKEQKKLFEIEYKEQYSLEHNKNIKMEYTDDSSPENNKSFISGFSRAFGRYSKYWGFRVPVVPEDKPTTESGIRSSTSMYKSSTKMGNTVTRTRTHIKYRIKTETKTVVITRTRPKHSHKYYSSRINYVGDEGKMLADYDSFGSSGNQNGVDSYGANESNQYSDSRNGGIQNYNPNYDPEMAQQTNSGFVSTPPNGYTKNSFYGPQSTLVPENYPSELGGNGYNGDSNNERYNESKDDQYSDDDESQTLGNYQNNGQTYEPHKREYKGYDSEQITSSYKNNLDYQPTRTTKRSSKPKSYALTVSDEYAPETSYGNERDQNYPERNTDSYYGKNNHVTPKNRKSYRNTTSYDCYDAGSKTRYPETQDSSEYKPTNTYPQKQYKREYYAGYITPELIAPSSELSSTIYVKSTKPTYPETTAYKSEPNYENSKTSVSYTRVSSSPGYTSSSSVSAGGYDGYSGISTEYSSPSSSEITYRIGDDVSKPTEYLCGLRQGCPASPILFDFYINDLFKDVQGVHVPGLTSRIPGLLFADDAVLLAESEAEMQTSLNKITDWSNTWEMTVNASKCGLMNVAGPQSS